MKLLSLAPRMFRYAVLLAGAVTVTLASSAHSFTLTDDPSVAGSLTNTIYYGGTDTYNNPNDIIGSSTFSILDAVINRSGANNDTLNIIINTNFAGAPSTNTNGPALGTVYGSLFLSPGFWTPSGTAATNYSTDNYVTGNKQWSYAVTNPTGVPGNTNPVGLYAIGTVGSAVNYGSSGVPQYYTTADGRVYMSYAGGNGNPTHGNPISAPATGNAGDYFRQGQAVQFAPRVAAVSGTSATFTVGAGYIEYSIIDNGLLGNTFALAWAMTCANDVIQGQVQLGSGDLTGTTPLPAALPLFATGLGMIGLLGWRRKRKEAA
jgi:hypothetical protein